MSRIFISYRRDDSADVSGRIYDRLEPRYGRGNVFKDVDAIPLGADFRRVLAEEVAKCDVMLVIIGRQWVSITDDHGQRRLDNPADFVRIEVEAALERGIPVIPLQVQNAPIPHVGDLPPTLAELPYRNGITVHGDPHFHRDMDLLIGRLDTIFSTPKAEPVISAGPPSYIPQRLWDLGFRGMYFPDGTELIVPPVCDVPAETFLMGSDPSKDTEAFESEQPQRSVTLAAFQIAKFPVTVAEYACFVRAGFGEPTGWEWMLRELDHPVVNVSWHDATAYARWLAERSGQPWRLPCEAEWEKAARGTDGRIYPWGDIWDQSCANTDDGGTEGTTSVGTYPSGASPYGALDMAGNVFEWTSSLYEPYPYDASDGRERRDSDAHRVRRGGSWYTEDIESRAAYRSRDDPYYPDDFVGFRLIRGVRAVVTS